MRRWLTWQLKVDPETGKARKVPYYVAGGAREGTQGSAADRTALSTYGAARAKSEMVGFALLDGGIVALDFDDCVTNGVVHPQVEDIVRGTYAELSPSGTGVRAFFRGTLPDHKDAHGKPFGLETFCRKGFVTVTGNLLECCALFYDPDAPLPDLSPEALRLYHERFGSPTERTLASNSFNVLEAQQNATEETLNHIESALAALPDEWADDRGKWLEMMFAIASLKGTDHEDRAEEIARNFSARSPKYWADDFAKTWAGLWPKELTYKTIFERAQVVGWKNPRSAEAKTDQRYAAADEWKAKISAAGDERTLREAVCPEIASDDRLGDMDREALAQAVLAAFKRLGTKYPVAQVRRLVYPPRAERESTHDAYARRFLADECTKRGGIPLVGVEGELYGFDADGIYRGRETSALVVAIAEAFDGQEHCETRQAYVAIAAQVYDIAAAGNEDFFADAPLGLPHAGRFYRIDESGNIVNETLRHDHRQRYESPAAPVKGPMPLFEKFLGDTFKHEDPTETNEQVAMMQEVFGAVALGLMAPQEKVVLFHGPGRAGKGTMLKIIENLVHPDHRSAISPFKWDHEYYLAGLAFKRLNVVGELPQNQPINDAAFKGVVGRDLLTGRHPNHRPFDFRNEAAHVFNSNFFVNTADRTEAFFTRWLLIDFSNSLIERPADIDVNLADQIVAAELPAILAWAMEGAQRLLRRRSFQVTRAHRRLMDRWRVRTDPIIEFFRDADACVLESEASSGEREGLDFKVKRTAAYEAYASWCARSGRKPHGKMRFNDEVESPAVRAMGIKVARTGTEREVLRGVHVWHPFSRPEKPVGGQVDLFDK